MNKDDSNFDRETRLIEFGKILKKEFDEEEQIFNLDARVINALTRAQNLLQPNQKMSLEASFLGPHVQYCFDKKEHRSSYSLCSFFEMVISLCEEITNNCVALAEQKAEDAAEVDKLDEKVLMRWIMDGEDNKPLRLVTAVDHELTVINLAMNSLMSRVAKFVQELEQNSFDKFITTTQSQKIYRGMYAVATASKEAVSNIKSRVGTEIGGDKRKKAAVRIDEALKISYGHWNTNT